MSREKVILNNNNFILLVVMSALTLPISAVLFKNFLKEYKPPLEYIILPGIFLIFVYFLSEYTAKKKDKEELKKSNTLIKELANICAEIQKDTASNKRKTEEVVSLMLQIQGDFESKSSGEIKQLVKRLTYAMLKSYYNNADRTNREIKETEIQRLNRVNKIARELYQLL